MPEESYGPAMAVRPILVGILVDVSASMVSSSLRSSSPSQTQKSGTSGTGDGSIQSRIQSVSQALDDLVARGAELSRQGLGQSAGSMLEIFMYGFGFGGALASIMSSLFGRPRGNVEPIRDLLALPGVTGSTVDISHLAQNWADYRSNVERMLPEMLGETPMASAFRTARDRFRREVQTGGYAENPIFLVISDGEPTPEDWAPNPSESVIELAEEMRRDGVSIISCLLTKDDVAEPRQLHDRVGADWPAGARVLFDCASTIPEESPFHYLASEYGWEIKQQARLFAQINHTDVLAEFSELVISRIEAPTLPTQDNMQAAPEIRPSQAVEDTTKLRIFLSYSHQDRRYLREGELLDYISGLRKDGLEIWSDERIETGDLWDEAIRREIGRADVALALVSQAFLNSKYCQDVEISSFLEMRKREGLRILPVILSPCDWRSHPWLAATQVRPRQGTLETAFKGRAKRQEIYLEILRDIKDLLPDV